MMETRFQTSPVLENIPALTVLIVAAIPFAGTFQNQAAPEPQKCVFGPVPLPSRPSRLDGTVLRLVAPDQVRAITKRVQIETGAAISPAYASLPRIEVQIVTPRRTFNTIAAVVDGDMPRLGEHVDILTRYRDPRLACHFIPWTVARPAAVS